mmetsp:Transcript_150539/g.266183  ORF Transcript_150539/g.266183 Transcript_150539/m.266183 type:complete len:87 (-) Transcript_150539:1098-1358(-)
MLRKYHPEPDVGLGSRLEAQRAVSGYKTEVPDWWAGLTVLSLSPPAGGKWSAAFRALGPMPFRVRITRNLGTWPFRPGGRAGPSFS